MPPNWTEGELRDTLARRGGKALPKAKGRRVRVKGLNKTEQQYAAYLDLLMHSGELLWYGFEAIKIRIGANCWYTPDFLIMRADGSLEAIDTKGAKGRKGKQTYYAEDDAIVKARAMGHNFPIPIRFTWRQHDGEWATQEM